MSETKFTPGPWKAEYRETSLAVYQRTRSGAKTGRPICVIARKDHANAELIAAAPDLYAALEALSAHMDRAGGDRDGMPECPWCKAGPDGVDHRADCELEHARAALAKAKGTP